jgi:RNA polymerase sigma factor (sigma-70 family)
VSPRASTRLLATQSDQRLLELVANGHERAFEAVVNRYRRPLLSYCRRMGLADSRAEDVLQQSLLKAWLALQRGTDVRELRPWLYRIVHNTAINAIRSSPEEQGTTFDAAHMDTVAAESQLERSIAARDALTDVAALPPMQRDAILLSALDGRSHEEVASALGITNGAVRGLLYRARAALRSAAAIFTPQPLLAWASGSASRVTPTAGRIAELSAGGGGEAGGMLLKGVAVAATAAFAAGAVLVPGHHATARPAAHARASVALAAVPAAAPVSADRSASTGGSTGAGKSGSRSTSASPGTIGPVAGGTQSATRTTRGGGGTSRQTGTSVPQRAVAPGAGVTLGAAGASHPAEAATSGPAKGTPEAGHSAEAPPPTGTTGKEEDGGAAEREREAAQEKSEREAAAAHEQTEREAEAAHEKAEREAELARERKEREAEEAREREKATTAP